MSAKMFFNEISFILSFIFALVVSACIFPSVLRFARQYGIVDNPNARKLQRVPVPVLGGTVVYCGILSGILFSGIFLQQPVILIAVAAMTVMAAIGTWDDIKDISALLRLAIEVILVLTLVFSTGFYIDHLNGIFGFRMMNLPSALLLSVVAGVGIINAVNLIDGVDGYSSGYGIFACTCFAVLFHKVGDAAMLSMALATIGALIPFFLHNVFGRRSKMFIGDGGTLMLGMLMTVFVFSIVSSQGPFRVLDGRNVCLPALTLAVLCIPVFDTLRVMTVRLLKGRSPFSPDKTHLHHLFIDMGFSHLGAALSILLINALVVLLWFLLWREGASQEVQAVVVILVSILITFGFYSLMKLHQQEGPVNAEGRPQGTKLWKAFCKIGRMSHYEKGRLWKAITWFMDYPMMGCRKNS